MSVQREELVRLLEELPEDKVPIALMIFVVTFA